MPEPVPTPGQVVVEVRHSSLNAAELFFAGRSTPGTVLGFDAAGVVVETAADGTGPTVGSRVVSFASGGGWAERRAVNAIDLAVVPDSVDLAEAATLPVAAGTALRALWQAGPIAGRRVLVTGASGGVGSFAVQLAAIGGAHVIASVGSAESGKGLAELGADEVVFGPENVSEPVDVVIDMVGGRQLVTAYGLLTPGGSLQSVGWASGEAAVLEPGSTLGRPAPTFITSVYNGSGLTDRPAQLKALLDLVAAGRLKPKISWRGRWDRIAEAAEALADRRLQGKAVLDVKGT
ncbi:zinc-binding dehydrogenase [Nonomuraea rhodomycinica]|uniref:zinc-binding dehydrogenase n=1 Tax=Nonomuraea rhodomycinica TaxID=1712872 RepID=UPI0028A87EAC|nr:zinc-binding dehydrogenase [Nonomuraea rhodomycinica]